jgi:hypothetical protein
LVARERVAVVEDVSGAWLGLVVDVSSFGARAVDVADPAGVIERRPAKRDQAVEVGGEPPLVVGLDALGEPGGAAACERPHLGAEPQAVVVQQAPIRNRTSLVHGVPGSRSAAPKGDAEAKT